MTATEIRKILTDGDFGRLLGQAENDNLEAKDSPYQLAANDIAKLEFAKDVSALANAGGGVLIVGARTRKSPIHLGDEIFELSLFQQRLVDVDQCLTVLRAWVYPEIEGLEIGWFPSTHHADKGLVAIFVPPQSDTTKPFVIAHTIVDGDKRRDIVFGYSERRRAGVESLKVQVLQTYLRDGRRLDQIISDRFAGIEAQLQELRLRFSSEAPRVVRQEPAVSPSEVKARRRRAAEDTGLA